MIDEELRKEFVRISAINEQNMLLVDAQGHLLCHDPEAREKIVTLEKRVDELEATIKRWTGDHK
jgi:uncharacterized protein with PhoU and TrkA domain